MLLKDLFLFGGGVAALVVLEDDEVVVGGDHFSRGIIKRDFLGMEKDAEFLDVEYARVAFDTDETDFGVGVDEGSSGI